MFCYSARQESGNAHYSTLYWRSSSPTGQFCTFSFFLKALETGHRGWLFGGCGNQSVRRGRHERSATGSPDCVETPRGHALGVFIVAGPRLKPPSPCDRHSVSIKEKTIHMWTLAYLLGKCYLCEKHARATCSLLNLLLEAAPNTLSVPILSAVFVSVFL